MHWKFICSTRSFAHFSHLPTHTQTLIQYPPNVWLIYRIFKHIYTILIWLLSISIHDGDEITRNSNSVVLSTQHEKHTSRINNFVEWITDFCWESLLPSIWFYGYGGYDGWRHQGDALSYNQKILFPLCTCANECVNIQKWTWHSL